MSTRFPFAGDVAQAINPWNFFMKQMGQIGLININMGKTPAPELEQSILDDVGSYGRQIGRLADAVDVLVGTLDRSKLEEPQLRAIMAFREQLISVRALKSKGAGAVEEDLSKPAAKLAAAALPKRAKSK